MYIASGEYPWSQIYERSDRKRNLAEIATICADAGYDGFEGLADQPEQTAELVRTLTSAGLGTRSIYANALLHDRDQAPAEIDRCTAIARVAKPAGLECLVVNPVPVDWNKPINKDDTQLSVQLEGMIELGRRLREEGVTLSYHTHDSEMRAAARELHHMLLNTSNEVMTWCLDADWIYRGAEMSIHAVMDLARLYADRVSVVHIRQSQAGTWLTAAADGDISYGSISEMIRAAGRSPLLVAEQIPPDPAAAYAGAAKDAETTIESIRRWFASAD